MLKQQKVKLWVKITQRILLEQIFAAKLVILDYFHLLTSQIRLDV